MQDNTNRAIAINSLILYVRLAVVSICGLIYTRFSLQALGVVNYGLFNVVGGIISMVAVLNTIMVSTSNRFMASAIGRNDPAETNLTFHVNLKIHVLIALLTILLAIPLGYAYINHYIHYDGDIHLVRTIYTIIIAASAFSFVGVPYNGLLLARERFLVFCTTDILSAFFKLACTWWLIDHGENKVILYALITATMTAYPTLVFQVYCHRHFADIVRFRWVPFGPRDTEILRFAGSMSIGAIAYIAKTQGSALIINAFFTTVTNTALAIATAINNLIQTFATNIQKSIAPQITKNYVQENSERYTYLVCLSSKMTYCVMLCIGIPFLLIPETIIQLWLGQVPEYSSLFIRLLVIDMLIASLNAGIPDLVFATGRVFAYQVVINLLSFLSVVVGAITLKCGMPAHMLFVSYILFSTLIFILRPLMLRRVIVFKVRRLMRDVYLPVSLITLLLVPSLWLRTRMNDWGLCLFSEITLVMLIFFIGLNRNEQIKLLSFVKEKLHKQ